MKIKTIPTPVAPLQTPTQPPAPEPPKNGGIVPPWLRK